ncbi:site-specific integrase [Marinilabiliaceae bacterium JC017]|nr:site-specific integrase [Marinilabiliaceae bacterium JC017]
MTTQTFSVQFLVRPVRKDKERGTIYVRITASGQRTEFSLKTKVQIEAWNNNKERLVARSGQSQKMNHFLDNVKGQLLAIYRELVLKKQLITPEIIKNHFHGFTNEEYTLMNLVDYHAKSQKNILSWGTLKNYNTTARYLSEFLLENKKTSDIYLQQLSYRFITEFESFLRTYHPVDHQRPLSNNGVMKHLERLRKLVNMAVKLEWLEKNPFEKYRLSFKKTERHYLSQEELNLIQEKDFSIERLQFAKDLFVFSCYTGLAYIDVSTLTPDNLVLGIDGYQWIHTKRKKTDIPVHIPLLPVALEIIEKYKEHPRALHKGTLLPIVSNQKLNSYLKEIADLCNITKNLTFHVARHTFATTVTLSNGVPMETVSKILGHSKLATTQIYARVLENKISVDMADLRNKLTPQNQQNLKTNNY